VWEWDPRTLVRLRCARTATIAIIPTPALPTVIMALSGLRMACSSAPGRGSMATTVARMVTSAEATMAGATTVVVSMAEAITGMDSTAADTTVDADLKAATVFEADMAMDSTVEKGFTVGADSMAEAASMVAAIAKRS
jgi:hypothetical protein